MGKRYQRIRVLALLNCLCYAGKNGFKGCVRMKIRILCFLLAVLSLTACGTSAEENASASQAEKSASEPKTSDQHTWDLRPYADWTFEPDPYLVSGVDYEALFSGTACGSSAAASSWFSVPALFPFTEIQEIGACEGIFDWETNTCDEAWAIANRYYSLGHRIQFPRRYPAASGRNPTTHSSVQNIWTGTAGERFTTALLCRSSLLPMKLPS